MERLKIDSRIGLVGGMVLMMSGAVLLADWQGFDANPCSSPSMNVSTLAVENNATNSINNTQKTFITDGSGGSGLALSSGWWNNDSIVSIRNNGSPFSTNIDRELCESQSISIDECFWNPKSRVTGEHCTTCRPVCLSTQKSLNFVQFSIGVALIAIMLQPGVVFYIVVASNITNKQYQVCVGLQTHHIENNNYL